ncbi:MAG TPA: hypothetical protein VGH19_09745 [Verrucomicrobiae bacterium]
MSAPENSKNESAKASAGGGEQLAVNFVSNELAQARASLKKAQIIGIVLLLFVGGYMFILTSKLKPYLTPQGAASTANDVIYAQVTERAPVIADDLKKRVPEMVAKIPDMVIEKMPEWREQIEVKVEDTLRGHLHDHSVQLGKRLDVFLTDHQVQIGELLAAANDKQKLGVVMTAIEQDLLGYMNERFDEKESIKEKLDAALSKLTHMEKQMDRLANANDLTAQEKKTRRAIAIIAQKVDTARQ